MEKYVYLFSEGNKNMRDLLGGKGANLAEMINMGLPVPNGFIVTTKACNRYYDLGMELDDRVQDEVFAALEKLENIIGKKMGDSDKPLLLSVRSGSPISMPGMMDTILNLGLNDEIARKMARNENNIRFVYDSYRRLIMMFADVVMGKGKDVFEEILNAKKRSRGAKSDLDLNAEDMYDIAMESKRVYKKIVGTDFPENPKQQLLEAIKAVFRSWNTDRAKVYRKMNNISDKLGTAVNIQEMVYGNLTDNSLTGVVFSRNPANGEVGLYGEYLKKAQGEDIVSGVRTPKQIASLSRDYPKIYKELSGIAKILEKHYRDMQDMEFTVENGKLYMLQTRAGKRTTRAALKIAVDMVKDGMITKEEAIMRVDNIDDLLHPTFDEEELKKATLITTGLPASPGAVSGKIYFNVESVVKANDAGENAILVRNETSPEDIEGMSKAVGVLTVRGGMTSHAAVVARGIGKCCISGCKDLFVDEENKIISYNGKILNEGDFISLNGFTGKVYEGIIKTAYTTIDGDFEEFLQYAKDIKVIGVRANAETENDARLALKFGAEGIGLCRSEHMFFEEKKIFAIRKMIVAGDDVSRNEALAELLVMQRDDFAKIFRVMNNKKVVIRYLDPPLHEFLPKTDDEIIDLAKSLNLDVDVLKEKVNDLKEFNPMMGHRGCRLAITYPEIAVMQTEAIMEAVFMVMKEGYVVNPEIMLPLIGTEEELLYLKGIVINKAEEIIKKHRMDIKYKVGTMIEVPRAVIIADELAKNADFFSFGTNDLTQMTYGFSRDDAGSFLNDYLQKGILRKDPFKTIDVKGVGQLVKVATILARRDNPDIEIGVCGEHGGDADSIEFFNEIGLDYVSCSPYRVPAAIVAAAKANIREVK